MTMDTSRPETHQWLKELPLRTSPTAIILAASALCECIPPYRITGSLRGTLYHSDGSSKGWILNNLTGTTAIVLITLLAVLVAFWLQVERTEVGR